MMFFSNPKLLRCECKQHFNTYVNGMSTILPSAAFLYSLLNTLWHTTHLLAIYDYEMNWFKSAYNQHSWNKKIRSLKPRTGMLLIVFGMH